MNKINVLFIVLLVFSCQQQSVVKTEQAIDAITMAPNRDVGEVKWLVVTTGNVDDYSDLVSMYMDNDQLEDIIPYALLMANKYHCADAYYDVYMGLLTLNGYLESNSLHNQSLDSLDATTRSLALDYLQKAYQQGNSSAIFTMAYYYKHGKYFPQDTVLANKLYKSW